MFSTLLKLETLLALTSLAYATTSSTTNDVSALAATDAVVVGHLFPACNGRKVRKPLNVPVDRCLSTPSLALEIKSAAICANGTRALWARFPEKGCGNGVLDPEYGLVDLKEDDVGTCLDVMKISSMAFWCDGVKPKSDDDDDDKKDDDKVPEDQSKKGSVSESACMVGKAPFWNHPKADTCVNLKTEKIKLSAPAICANGTQSMLALYKGTGCSGGPAEFKTVEDEDSRKCSNVEGMGSFAFYCTGEGIGRNHGGDGLNRGHGGSGSILHFFLILAAILMISLLMLILSIVTWVRKYGGSMGKLIEFARGLIKPKEGGIAI